MKLLIDTTLPVTEQWQQYRSAQAALDGLRKGGRPRTAGARHHAYPTRAAQPDPIDTLRPHDMIKVSGVTGEFRVIKIDDRALHVWGGDKNRQKYRSFPLEARCYRMVKP